MMPADGDARRARRTRAVAAASAVWLCSVAVAACGGSSTTTPTQQAHPTPVPPETATTRTGSGVISSAAPGAQHASGGAASPTSGNTGFKPTLAPAQTPPLNPCTLISAADAQAIVGAALVTKSEAPLGPTCILSFKGQHADVTLAIERIGLTSTVHVMRSPRRVTIGGFRAYCGTLGMQTLLVSLGQGRVLDVTAPSCTIATALAAKALAGLRT